MPIQPTPASPAHRRLRSPGRFRASLAGLLVAAAAAFVVAPLVPAPAATPSADTLTQYSWFDPIIDVERMIAARFVTPPDLAALQKGAIDGMLEALGDQYTEYLAPEDIADFNKNIRGRYVGIGASVRAIDGMVEVVSPLDGSPAYLAGVMAGDKIVAVDGASTIGVEAPRAVEMLTGEPGTTVVITLEREGERFDVSIVRKNITTRTVTGFRRANGDKWDYLIDPAQKIGYIRISQFTGGTMPEFEEAINELIRQDAQGLILDVRSNPGGLLGAATQMADMFLDDGLIVITRGRSHSDESVYAAAPSILPDIPLAMIVNRDSASASEVVAGALRDNDRAVIIGTRTFGKGSVQALLPLPSGKGQLKITEQHYYGPSGKNLHRTDDATEWGVDPSPGFFVPMTDREYSEMLSARREREIIRKAPGAAARAAADARLSSPDWIIEDYKDKQLAAAVEAMRIRLEEGEWVPTGEEMDEHAVEVEELQRLQRGRERLLREVERVDKRVAALSAAVPADLADAPRLIPEGAALTGGVVEIRDSEGKVVATLSITGEGLERWLIDAPVVKREDPAENEE